MIYVVGLISRMKGLANAINNYEALVCVPGQYVFFIWCYCATFVTTTTMFSRVCTERVGGGQLTWLLPNGGLFKKPLKGFMQSHVTFLALWTIVDRRHVVLGSEKKLTGRHYFTSPKVAWHARPKWSTKCKVSQPDRSSTMLRALLCVGYGVSLSLKKLSVILAGKLQMRELCKNKFKTRTPSGGIRSYITNGF